MVEVLRAVDALVHVVHNVVLLVDHIVINHVLIWERNEHRYKKK